MKNTDVDEKLLKMGFYCQKDSPGCFCHVGWPVERQCPDCRGLNSDRQSYCICGPKEDE